MEMSGWHPATAVYTDRVQDRATSPRDPALTAIWLARPRARAPVCPLLRFNFSSSLMPRALAACYASYATPTPSAAHHR